MRQSLFSPKNQNFSLRSKIFLLNFLIIIGFPAAKKKKKSTPTYQTNSADSGAAYYTSSSVLVHTPMHCTQTHMVSNMFPV